MVNARNLSGMQPLEKFDSKKIKYVFADIDDTITTDGKLSAEGYAALWNLQSHGKIVIPVTGRPAGWCDMIARFWPVDAVIGENGAFYFKYDSQLKKMRRIWSYDDETRLQHRNQLKALEFEILHSVPKAAVSADQFSRLFDLAIDFCEDVPPLAPSEVQKIVDVFKKHGAQAKVSSIHVNGWFGDHDKLTMCREYCKNEWSLDIDKDNSMCLFIGDSPNDEPMFGHFVNSVGVANVNSFKDQLKTPPKFICKNKSGDGFVEMSEHLFTAATVRA